MGDIRSLLLISLGACGHGEGPTTPIVSFAEPFPSNDTSLVCQASASDPDGDELHWKFTWTVDGVPYTGTTATTERRGDTVPADVTRNSEVWTCTATVSDGEERKSATATVQVRRPNFVVFITDDQRFDSLDVMPRVLDLLVTPGVRFERAYVTTPLCCPERSSMLSGGFYAQETGVLNTTWPNGGAGRFVDDDTIATRLQEAGYTTALVGKYLNDYEVLGPYVPPGWSSWAGRDAFVDYYDWHVVLGTSTPDAPGIGHEVPQTAYITDVERDEAVDFIGNAVGPYFLYIGFTAPHALHGRAPAQPAPQDVGTIPNYQWRGRGTGETDLSDKPAWVRSHSSAAPHDRFVEDSLESLGAVDRAVADVVENVQATGGEDDTIFVFASDNGYMWGEHGVWGKALPYEESVRVPFVIREAGVPARSESALVAVNLDLPPTILAAAGVQGPTQGLSLDALLHGEVPGVRDRLFIEAWTDHVTPNWAGIVTDDGWKCVRYPTGDRELYDLVADPYELSSLHDTPEDAGVEAELFDEVLGFRGLTVSKVDLPPALAGVYYETWLVADGGRPPYTWTPVRVPDGLTLDRDGHVYGVIATSGRFVVIADVTDSSVSLQHGGPQRFERNFPLRVRRQ